MHLNKAVTRNIFNLCLNDHCFVIDFHHSCEIIFVEEHFANIVNYFRKRLHLIYLTRFQIRPYLGWISKAWVSKPILWHTNTITCSKSTSETPQKAWNMLKINYKMDIFLNLILYFLVDFQHVFVCLKRKPMP